ncbi:MAG TPA: DUF362 domain-containing protein [Candidatus Acidoferrum sp.]|jgi:uncharacterized protein (DUF362 family)|nr:DUF362 domain-containing protein [Candidatus Acidoferrum sp.]
MMEKNEPSKVAIVESNGDAVKALEKVVELIGKIDDLNTDKRSVVIKVGVFDHTTENHTTVEVVDAITKCFNKAPKILLVESDNYKGKGTERLQIWKKLFTKRIIPFNLSDDTDTRKVKIAGEEMSLSHVLFKPNVLVSTHVMRTFEKGSILKNLFGLIPDPKKARFHKKLDTLLVDVCEAVGGVDLAVLDGTYTYRGAGAMPHAGPESTKYRVKTNMLLVGRDTVAVETIGTVLVGLNPQKMPVLQEAKKRSLGEADPDKIEIVGIPLETAKERFSSVVDTFKRKTK